MTLLSALYTNLRLDLKDPSGTKWTDAELLSYFNKALDDYSLHFMQEKSTTLTVTADVGEYTLPADCREIVQVEHPANVFRAYREQKPGIARSYRSLRPWVTVRTTGYSFEAYGGKLILVPVPTDTTDNIKLRYRAPWSRFVSSGDTVPILQEDEELLNLYAWHLALMRDVGQDALLRRWTEQGRRDDNPVYLVESAQLKEYRKKIAEREERRGAFRTICLVRV